MDKIRYQYASDVNSGRDGLGLEVWQGTQMLLEIFQDDAKGTVTLNTFGQDIALETVCAAIAEFKNQR
ncbi:hypothetical protein L1281_000069 [Neisseria sp. HSC-16F19]|nr:hypothetical protein [Neisseria sp. HSC-16F19]MCP2039504.1 hypothetical protein [Neisseria sp. HSC-16F19]